MADLSTIQSIGSFQVTQLNALKIQNRQVQIRDQIDAIRKQDTLSETDRLRRSTLTTARSFNDNSVKAFDTLSEKLNAVRKSAQGISGGQDFLDLVSRHQMKRLQQAPR